MQGEFKTLRFINFLINNTKHFSSYGGSIYKINIPIIQSIVLPNIRQVVEHWLLRHPEHADNPERSLVLAKSDGARCPFGFLDQRAA